MENEKKENSLASEKDNEDVIINNEGEDEDIYGDSNRSNDSSNINNGNSDINLTTSKYYCWECKKSVLCRIHPQLCCEICGSSFVELLKVEEHEEDSLLFNTMDNFVRSLENNNSNDSNGSHNHLHHHSVNNNRGSNEGRIFVNNFLDAFPRRNNNEEPRLGDFLQHLFGGRNGGMGNIVEVDRSGNPIQDSIGFQGLFGSILNGRGGGIGGIGRGQSRVFRIVNNGGMRRRRGGAGQQVGDYFFGNLDDLINQFLEQGGNNGDPPASEDDIERKIELLNPSESKESEEKIKHMEEHHHKCPICMEEFNVEEMKTDKEKVAILPCQHRYHHQCVTQWLRMHDSCPVCRKSLSGKKEEKEEKE